MSFSFNTFYYYFLSNISILRDTEYLLQKCEHRNLRYAEPKRQELESPGLQVIPATGEGTVSTHRLRKGAETSRVIFSWKRVRISSLSACLQGKFASVIKLLKLHRSNSLFGHSCFRRSAQAGSLSQSNHGSVLPYEYSEAICQLVRARWLPSEMLRTALLMVEKNC